MLVPKIHINPAIDTLFFRETLFSLVLRLKHQNLRSLHSNNSDSFRRLAVPVMAFTAGATTDDLVCSVVADTLTYFLQFQKLEQLIIIFGYDCSKKEGGLALYGLFSVPLSEWPSGPLHFSSSLELFTAEARGRLDNYIPERPRQQYRGYMKALATLATDNPGWNVPEVIFKGIFRE
jgi:hypothetical protein